MLRPECSVAHAFRLRRVLRRVSSGTLQVWPEVTDPEKFVYEDVAIAAYLLVGTHLIARRGGGGAPGRGGLHAKCSLYW